MAANIADYFGKYSNGSQPIPTTLSAQKLAGATTASLTTATGWDTTTVKHVRMYTTTVSGSQTIPNQSSICIYKATLSGTTLSNLTLVWSATGSDQTYAAGATVDLAVTPAYTDALATGALVEHGQDGTHSTALITSRTEDTAPDPDEDYVLTYDTSATALKKAKISNLQANTTGWIDNVLPAVSSVTANGNRSYTCTFNSNDLTSTLSPGMRLRTTRTVAAPTQCTSLNGTTQYYSKSSPAAMTFTDDFVVSAWVKLTSYPSGDVGIMNRGTSTGYWFGVTSSGQLILNGFKSGGGNYRRVTSYQSLPLNKWVHVTAQLDMSAYTATTTTCYVMIDGVDVPAFVAQGGSNPTDISGQTGDLNIGAIGGANFFPGKIAQVAIYNAKVTQATILATISQGLSGSETSLISAYNFNNAITDLSANANNLTANGSAVATNADSPFGTQASGLISATLDYGIIQSVTFSTNTTVVVQVPEGCTIPTSGGVTSVAYSVQGNPYGWVSDKGRWPVMTMLKNFANQASPVAGTWYNPSSIKLNIPVGQWLAGYDLVFGGYKGAATSADAFVTLSTGAATESDTELTSWLSIEGAASTLASRTPASRKKGISTSAATDYYINIKSSIASMADIATHGNSSPTIVSALPSAL